MPLEKEIGDAATALSQNQYVDALDGTYWIDGWDATLGAGDLEVDIAPGEGAINTGSVETTETQTVDFAADVDADDPRKAVISVDDTGTVQKTLGDAMPAEPEGEVRERTFDPAPPTNAPGVVVAEVWLDASVSSLVGGDVRDRRVTNTAGGATVTVTDPGESEPGVGVRGDLWYELIEVRSGLGVENWTFDSGGTVESEIPVSSGSVYTGSGSSVYALDIDTGSEDWVFSAAEGVGKLVLDEGVLYAGEDASFIDGQVYSIDADTGSENWSFQAGDTINGLATLDDLVYVGPQDEELYALDKTDGTEEWVYNAADQISSEVAASDGLVYAGDFSDNAFALDALTGDVEWTTNVGERPRELEPSGTTVFVLGQFTVYALSVTDGSVLWEVSKTGDSISFALTESDGRVFFVDDDDIRAVDATDGSELWAFEDDEAKDSQLTVEGDELYFGSESGNVYSVNTADGTQTDVFETGSAVESGITVKNESVHFGNNDGTVYSVEQALVRRHGGGRVSDGDDWIEPL